LDQLEARTKTIEDEEAGDPRSRTARRIYDQARQAGWFTPVVDVLRSVAEVDGAELCMYCSANEPSQVEHYRPVSVFPEEALKYENYLWSCDICNRTHKGERFPPDTEPGAQILNPLDDDVWCHFFLDPRFGRLIRRVAPDTLEPLPRSLSTCRVVGIDREQLQTRRQRRYRNLRREANQTLKDLSAGVLSLAEVGNRVADWRSDPFQADVADYFLNGPGRLQEPFRSVLEAMGEVAGA